MVNRNGQVLVASQHGDSWSLPKGHIEPGEDALTAAKREIHEETGITNLELVMELGSYERPRIGKGGKGDDPTESKNITLFLFRTDEMDLKPIDPENPEAKWVDIDGVASLLTHKKDIEFFEKIKSKIV